MPEPSSDTEREAASETPKGGRADRDARQHARLAAALKANLHRRKQQARSRATAGGDLASIGADHSHESAEFAADKPLSGSTGRGD